MTEVANQCVRCGPLSDEFPEPTQGGQRAGRCTQPAEFKVYQGGDDPDLVCYGHLAQTVAAQSPRNRTLVERLSMFEWAGSE